ncbi:MAG: hypothetical protein CMJ96_03720 [Planctomycetes bacterium]|nr:hypothetical protein [Planctomycetota bacterium]MDP7245736.1 hypothetical protein [Planctomycetota bacterium]MDP7559343.1 hypothetical protein [Planctomycetota bacterium]|tara:strand:- start:3511 stop:4128 length:618 start_codon:yes stop_codon:yes gene_type:complete
MSPKAQLAVYASDGRCAILPLPPLVWEQLLAVSLEASKQAQLEWEKLGMTSHSTLLALIPEELAKPLSVSLRKGRRFTSSSTLQIEIPAMNPEGYAEDFLRQLKSTSFDQERPLQADSENEPFGFDGKLNETEDFPSMSARADDGLIPEDLAWMMVGDWLDSPKYGKAKILRVEEGGLIFLQLESGEERVFRPEEILSEFRFLPS